MKTRTTLVTVVLGVALVGSGCATYQPSKGLMGAGMGAAGGALMGQAIGHNTKGTLIGTGVGSLLGLLVGNEMDRRETQQQIYAAQQQQQSRPALAYPPSSIQQPPGEWKDVQGTWHGGSWYPQHQTWVPVQPQ